MVLEDEKQFGGVIQELQIPAHDVDVGAVERRSSATGFATGTAFTAAGCGRRSSDAFSATLGSVVRIRSVSRVLSNLSNNPKPPLYISGA